MTAVAAAPSTALTASNVAVSEGKAKWLGIPLVTLFAVGMTALALLETWHILTQIAVLAGDVYVFLGLLYFWFSRSFKDGVTVREAWYNALWFLGLRRLIKSVQTRGIQHASGLHIDAASDGSWRLCRTTKTAVIIGLVLTLASLGILPVLIAIHLFHLAVSAAWFTAAVWGLCDAVYYVFGRLWVQGLSRLEVFLSIFGGPFAVAVRAFKASRLRKHQLEAAHA